MRIVYYTDPLTGKNYEFLTNALDLPAGVIAELYRRRWEAEKVFDEIKNKLEEKKYYSVSLYPGGLRVRSLQDQLAQFPDRVIRTAVWGMLPHNKLGRAMLKKLKVYAGPSHPHAAQKPSVLN